MELTNGQLLREEFVENLPLVKIEEKLEDFGLEIYDPNTDEVVTKQISDFEGKWFVLFFYPADFTFVCPTELRDLNRAYEEIKAMDNVELLVVSTDTVFSHKGWVESEPLLKGFNIPMVSDRATVLSRYFGILNEQSGNSERATYIVSPEGVLKTIEIHTEPVGRSARELVRKLKALKFVTENPGHVCPASWETNDATLQPSIKISGKVGEQL